MRSTVDRRRLEQLYDRYRDPQDENKIGIDGIQQFCDDLSLDPASVSVLVIAWKFRAATQCEFTKKEFVDGMTELGTYPIAGGCVKASRRHHWDSGCDSISLHVLCTQENGKATLKKHSLAAVLHSSIC
uniref:DCN1-like protein n=1 Tax=Felis catus TaxID=9685 RepID=A0ABI7YRG7_FELCA